MIRRLKFCLIVALLAFSSSASAGFYFLESGVLFVLKDEISYRPDAGQATGFENVSVDNDGWTAQKSEPFKATGTPLRLWAKFDLPTVNAPRRVMIDIAPWESVEYFVVHDGRLVDRQVVGVLVPWGERTTHVSMTPSLFHAGFATIDQPAGANVAVYARLATTNRFVDVQRLRIVVWDAAKVLEGEQRDRLVQGIFFGIVLVLVLYNLTLFVLDVRELSYLYYVILELGSCAVFALLYGLSTEFLWPNHPAWDYFCSWTIPVISIWAAVQFVRHYLDTYEYFPKGDGLLKWWGMLQLLLIPVYWLAYVIDQPVHPRLVLLAHGLIGSATIIILLVVTALALKRRHPLAPLFAIAVFFAGVGGLVSGPAMLGH